MTHNLMPLLIAVSGKLGTGKDYIAEHELLPMIKGFVSRMAFADHVKVTVAAEDPAIDIIECLQGVKSPELRRRLQVTSTEKGRDIYGPDIWIRALENWIKIRRLRDGTPDIVLVTDCRFINEAQWIMEHGGLLIRIKAPSRNEYALQQESKGNPEIYQAIKSHPSETELDEMGFEYSINNEPDAASLVKEQIKQIITSFLSAHPEYRPYFHL